jgi:hypothetical protein
LLVEKDLRRRRRLQIIFDNEKKGLKSKQVES